MIIIPAIDLQDGAVVRFVQGKLNKKVYSKDPVKTAKHWVRQGAGLLHVVDLDAAFTGVLKNISLVKEIARGIDVPIQFGGGVRNINIIKELLDSGIWRVILGTKAVSDKEFLKKAFSKFGEKLIVSVDTREEKLLIKGWQSKVGGGNILQFIRLLKETGFKEIIYTDVSKDGTLAGPNIKAVKSLLKETGIKIIASGGVSSLADIARLKLLQKQGLVGVIIGKALYEGRFTLSEALKLS